MTVKQGFVGLVALALGCSAELESETELEAEDEVAEIVENLRLAGNPEDEIEVRDDGTVVLGGDAVVSLEASREMIGHGDHDDHGDHDLELRQYRTTNLVGASVDTICISATGFTGNLSTAVDDAIANYTALSLRFDMVRTSGMAAGCDALITFSFVNGTGASSGFPANGLPYDTVLFGDDILPTYGLAAATHVITHELGHTIGFRHTDYYNRSISCGAGGNEGDAGVGVVHIDGTPTTATLDGSVMNACYNAGSTGEWTAGDLTALTALYGSSLPAAPSPLTRTSEACYGLNYIDWAAVAGATSYQLWRSSSSGFGSPVMIYSGNLTDADINVPSGTWYLRAKACNANGCSAWTNQVSATRVAYCS